MSRTSPRDTFIGIAIVLVFAIAAIVWFITAWNFLWIWLISINVVTFLAYGYDKGQAKNSGMRVPEVILHGLALAGGFLGGWIGRYAFHHKTRKTAFTAVLSIATIGWVLILFFQ